MNYKLILVSFLIVIYSSVSTGRASSKISIGTDDTDISPRADISRLEKPPLELVPDEIQKIPSDEGLVVEILRENHSKLSPVIGLQIMLKQARNVVGKAITGGDGRAKFKSCPEPGAKVSVSTKLEGEYFRVINGSEPYQVSVETTCSSKLTIIFKQDSNGGQALGIWQVAQRAQQKLQDSVGLDFWKERLDFSWPEDGDYYSFGQVNITRGDHWDVVGHEMGHGIYHLAKIGGLGGGPHKIDECYSEVLALSEGWASFFSGWVSVDLNDPDAKFEYMVPRRAPIQFENVPADVCKGEANEWRVTSFFWDLIDLHADGEHARETFARIWKALADTRVQSASEALGRLERLGIDRDLLSILWDLNFQTR